MMDSVRLADVCSKIGSGATPRGGTDVYQEHGVALIRSQNVHNGGFRDDGLVYLDDEHARDLDGVAVQPGDVLLNITGDSVARACEAPSRVGIARVNQHVAIIRPDPSRLNARFLRYFLVSPTMQAHMLALASAGATRNALTKGMIEDFRVPSPPLSTQRAIAHILGSLDDKIDLNRRMNKALEALARAIFKSWFVDFDPVRAKMEGRKPAGMDAQTAALFPDRMQETEIGEIPAGWTVQPIESLCDSLTSGGTPARMNPAFWDGGKIPWFKTGELLDGPLLDSEEHITDAAMENSSCKLWPSGTILFALYASPTVGRLGILTRPGTSNQAAAGLIVKPAYGVPFLKHILLEARIRLQTIAVGAAQQNINQGVLKSHRVVTPNAPLASAFSQLARPISAKQILAAEESRTLAALRDTLLPKLLSGELRIPDADMIVEAAL